MSLPDGTPAKLAIFFPQTDDVAELRPIIEGTLTNMGLSPTLLSGTSHQERQQEPISTASSRRLTPPRSLAGGPRRGRLERASPVRLRTGAQAESQQQLRAASRFALPAADPRQPAQGARLSVHRKPGRARQAVAGDLRRVVRRTAGRPVQKQRRRSSPCAKWTSRRWWCAAW